MTSYRFIKDPTGFPMIWVEAIDAYMHWLPVTKIQFEHYMCEFPERSFDDNWYDEIRSLNARETPSAIRSNNYWKAFITGIIPSECQYFANWCGNAYSIPTLEEWFTSYEYLKQREPLSDLSLLTNESSERVKTLLTRLVDVSQSTVKDLQYDHNLAFQMFMRTGVMEWVSILDQGYQSNWGGMGETNPEFRGSLFTPDMGQPSIPTHPETDRLRYYGFRLIRR